MTIAGILFAIAYGLMLLFSRYRLFIALGCAALFIVTGILPLTSVWQVIDSNVLLMIVGTMGMVALFIDSRMPERLAELLMSKVPTVRWAMITLALFAGIISAFVDNVATVLMVAPVALELCRKFRADPIPFIISIAVSSNLQGAATLVGDTTAIMLGSALDMSFADFFWYKGRPGMFFIVQLGAVITTILLFFQFRREQAVLPISRRKTIVTDYVPTLLLVGTVLSLILVSCMPNKPAITNGLICCGLFLVGLIHNACRQRRLKAILKSLKEIDFHTVGLLLGLFLMIGGLQHAGVIDAAAQLLIRISGNNLFLLYTVIVWASVGISAFIDNIPYVATMIPVIAGVASLLQVEPSVLYFGLLSGATLGGNCTPIGASANIAGIGILRKAGYTVKNRDFFRIGIPFTLAAIIPAYIVIWILYGI